MGKFIDLFRLGWSVERVLKEPIHAKHRTNKAPRRHDQDRAGLPPIAGAQADVLPQNPAAEGKV